MVCGNITFAMLAAGRGSRFGGRKLEVMIEGAMLGTLTANRLGAFDFGARVVVVDPAHTALIGAFAALGFKSVANDQSDLGLSHSVGLATKAAQENGADGLLICLADMPNISNGHIAAMLHAFADTPRIIASSVQAIAMPPALFPGAHFATLTALSGGLGAKALLADAMLIEADPWSMLDVDTPEDLAVVSRSYPPAKAPCQDPL
jgi:molybdenum cofactor cytidylyltransferase